MNLAAQQSVPRSHPCLCRSVLMLAGALALALVPVAVAGAVARPDVLLTGENAGDDFGWAVAGAGDVDGDGSLDVLVGAPSQDDVDGFAGRAYLFLGPLTADRLGGAADATISAEAFGDNLGVALDGAGDVDGDGFDDLLIAARGNDDGGIQAGRVYLFHGPVAGDLPALAADAIITGEAFEEVGHAAAGVGDIDGDGLGDVLLGAPLATGGAFSSGKAYFFRGPLDGQLDTADADGVIEGVFFDELLGGSLAAAGDLDGDGRGDLAVGATGGVLMKGAAGRVYIFFSPPAGVISANEADVILTGEAELDEFGTSVASAGDVDGDGFDDVVVGAWDSDAGSGRSGRAYVFHGPLAGTIPAQQADVFLTGSSGDQVGQDVAAAGDLDGDGTGDLLVGAPQFNDGDPGYAVAVFGGERAPVRIDLQPVADPVVVPPGGGPVPFDAMLRSRSAFRESVDLWLTLAHEGGLRRLLGPVTAELAPRGTLERSLAPFLPGIAPAGSYVLTGNVGSFPAAAASDAFGIEKLP